MPDLTPISAALAAILPFECFEATFMQKALFALILLAPLAAAMGVQVINFRMAFFSDAISHSAFAGVALGLILAIDPHLSMPLFGVAAGLGIIALMRTSNLSSDTVIGVVFSAMIALGLAMVSRSPTLSRDLNRYLFGDILTINNTELWGLLLLSLVIVIFQALTYNRLLYIGINPALAKAHRVPVALLQYAFAGLLSLLVMFSVWAVGVLLVTALLIVPAAAARNLAKTAGGMFWWALLVGLSSAVIGLIVSAQPWARTATGATIILCACAWFALSLVLNKFRNP